MEEFAGFPSPFGQVVLRWRCPTFRTPTGEDLGRLTVLAAPAADGWRWALGLIKFSMLIIQL